MGYVVDSLRTAWRSLRGASGFFVLAAATIALGVGLTTGIFSVVSAVLLEPLPYSNPDRLVAVGATTAQGAVTAASEPQLLDWRERVRSFESLEFTAPASFLILDDQPSVWLTGARASEGFFGMLGVAPLVGRTFAPREDQPGNHHVALISERLWRTRYGGDPRVIGRRVPIRVADASTDGAPSVEIIGILPGEVPIRYDRPYDVVMPYVFSNASRARGARRARELDVVARLKSNVSIQQASAEMRELSIALQRELALGSGIGTTIVRPLHEVTFGSTRRISLTLLGAVGVVLTIASVNLGALLLTRSARRRHELAVRVAIGASRARLLAEIAGEAVLLATVGGALGLAVSQAVARLFTALAPATLLRADQIQTDRLVLSFAIGTTVLCTVLASLGPAVRATRINANDLLKPQLHNRSRRRRATLVAVQAALVAIVLAGAALLVGSVWKLSTLPLGYSPAGVHAVEMIVPPDWMQDDDRRTTFEQALRARIGAMPGVVAVSASADVPMSGGSSVGVVPEGWTTPQMMTVTAADSAYLQLLGVPVVAGRGILETDATASRRVALVNRAFVRKYWSNGTAIGRRLTLAEPHEVVGIVEDVTELTDGKTRMRRGLVASASPAVYVPQQQFRIGRISWLLVRTSVPISARTLAVAVHQTDARVTLRNTTTLSALARAATIDTQFYAAVLALFAGISVLLAAVGVYGVVAHSVSERVREFGVRVALGATPGGLLRMVLRQTGGPLAAGTLAGLTASTQLTASLSAWVFGLTPTDPEVLLAVLALPVCAGLAAAWRPARRAATADPVQALRAE